MIATASLHVLQCAFALSALGINYYHESKTSLPKRWIMSYLISVGILSHLSYLQPIITQYFIDNKSEIWLLFLIAHSKR